MADRTTRKRSHGNDSSASTTPSTSNTNKRTKLSNEKSEKLVQTIKMELNDPTEFTRITNLAVLQLVQGWCVTIVYTAWHRKGQHSANAILEDYWNNSVVFLADPRNTKWWDYLDSVRVGKQIEIIKCLATNMVRYVDEKFVQALVIEK